MLAETLFVSFFFELSCVHSCVLRSFCFHQHSIRYSWKGLAYTRPSIFLFFLARTGSVNFCAYEWVAVWIRKQKPKISKLTSRFCTVLATKCFLFKISGYDPVVIESTNLVMRDPSGAPKRCLFVDGKTHLFHNACCYAKSSRLFIIIRICWIFFYSSRSQVYIKTMQTVLDSIDSAVQVEL